MSTDFPHRVPAVCCDTCSISFSAVADGDYPCRVAIPCQVIDTSGNQLVSALGVVIRGAVPDTDSAGSVTGSDVVARGGEASKGGRGGVGGVLGGKGRVVD